jgi:ribosomal protein L40E
LQEARALKEEILRPIIQIQKCKLCGTENAPIAVYCNKCGQILASAVDEKTLQRIEQLEAVTATKLEEFKRRGEELSRQTEQALEQVQEMQSRVESNLDSVLRNLIEPKKSKS